MALRNSLHGALASAFGAVGWRGTTLAFHPLLNKRQLTDRLGWQPSQVMRLFDGRHGSRLDQVEAALHVLGRRLVVTSAAG